MLSALRSAFTENTPPRSSGRFDEERSGGACRRGGGVVVFPEDGALRVVGRGGHSGERTYVKLSEVASSEKSIVVVAEYYSYSYESDGVSGV